MGDADRACLRLRRRQPTPQKAIRVCFLRNKDLFFRGVNMAISQAFYNDFNILRQGVTDVLRRYASLPSAIASFYRIDGTRIFSLNGFCEGDIVICCCRYENFAPLKYDVNMSYLRTLKSLIRWNDHRAGGEWGEQGLPPCISQYVKAASPVAKVPRRIVYRRKWKPTI